MSSSISDRTGRGALIPEFPILPKYPVLACSPKNRSGLQRFSAPTGAEGASRGRTAHCKGAAYYA